jgi:hypothetical protein
MRRSDESGARAQSSSGSTGFGASVAASDDYNIERSTKRSVDWLILKTTF